MIRYAIERAATYGLAAAITLTVLGLAGCESYNIGDVSKRYCVETLEGNRTYLRAVAQAVASGISVPDYCEVVAPSVIGFGERVSEVVDDEDED